MDYLETFAQVEKMNTIRILLSLAINFDRELMSIPPGFGRGDGNKVY